MTDTIDKLLPCPCGETPTELCISGDGDRCKWAYVFGDCCGDWEVEFRTLYHDLNSSECMALARERWNEIKRGWL